MNFKKKIALLSCLCILLVLPLFASSQAQNQKPMVVIFESGHGYGIDKGNVVDKNAKKAEKIEDVAYKESDLNEKIRNKLVENIKNQKQIPVEIVYDTNGELYQKDKTKDFPARDRPGKIKEWLKKHEKEYPDSVVISSHSNASPTSPSAAKGHEFYYGGGETKDKTFAFTKDMRRSLLDSVKEIYYGELQNTRASLNDVEKFMTASIAGFRSKDVYYADADRMVFLKGLSNTNKSAKEKLPSYAVLTELGFMTNTWELGNLTQEGAESFVNKAADDEANGLIKNLKKLNATKIILIMPSGDHPDDTYDYSSYVVSSFPMVKYKVKAPIGILENGYYFEATKLLDKLNHEYTLINPSSFDPSIAQEMPLLFIPSAGLMGLEESTFFKGALKSYVENGGNVIVLSQQRGYEFSVLPVPAKADGIANAISGYGWTEDQSCQSNSSYADTYHQILSGQTRTTPSFGVDGYFTGYPDNSTIILRRIVNGQPSLVAYDYGLGKIFMSTTYSDWAFANNQTSSEEIALIRDLVAYAKKPETLPEIKAGEAVNLNIEATNKAEIDASSVAISIFIPDGTAIINEQIIPISLLPSQTATIPVSYATTTTSPLGIYRINYVLLDSNNTVLQTMDYMDAGRFAVSNPPSNPYKSPDFSFAIQSDAEQYAYGSTATFTFNLWNNSDRDRQIRATWGLPHHGFGWDNYFNKTVAISAKGNASFTYTLENIRDLDRLRARFYDESGNQVGYAEKGIWMYYPAVSIALQTDKTLYKKGDTVTLSLNLQNKQNAAFTALLKIKVLDPGNTSIYSNTISIPLIANGTSTQALNFALPMTVQGGFYIASVEINDSAGRKIGGDSVSFELPLSQISVVPTLPSALSAGSNTISFNLSNTGRIGVNSGLLDISLKDPAGNIVYSESQSFVLGISQSITQSFNVNIPSLKFGNYTLSYTQSDETKTGKPTNLTIPNTAGIALSFDKTSYRIRETANLTVNLSNTGKFNLEVASVNVSVLDAGFSDTKIVSLLPATNNQQLTTFVIPETMIAGQHTVNVTLSLPSGSLITQSSKLTIPESSLIIGYSGSDTVNAGDTINLTIENTGGVDTTYTTEKLSITDGRGVIIYQGNLTGIVLAGEKRTLVDIQIPPQAVHGVGLLNIQFKDNKTLKAAYFYKVIKINGLLANLQAIADKHAYLKTEPITGIASLLNGQFDITDGKMSISVSRINPTISGQFTHFLPKTGWYPGKQPANVAVGSEGFIYVTDTSGYVKKLDFNNNILSQWGGYGTENGQFYSPQGLAVAPDKSVYVADGSINRIQKFDSNGNFITKWGSTCWVDTNGDTIPEQPCDGQFRRPSGIASGPDGAVYVVDTENNRIQKFDGNGNFITKWGGWCYTDTTGDWIGDIPCNGQFSWPARVAVGPDGSVYITDERNNRIQKFDSNGNYITQWGNYCHTKAPWPTLPDKPCNGLFHYPSGIAIGPDDFVYVVDSGNNRIQKFDSNGNFITKWGNEGSGVGQFQNPGAISFDFDGSVYVTDRERIQKFNSDGSYITKISRYCSVDINFDGVPDQLCDGEFRNPTKAIVAPDRSIYVADSWNYRIQKFGANGSFITKWGSYGNGDGQFGSRLDIAAAPDGTIYVADSDKNRIQRFDSAGNFIIKWGSYGSGDGQFYYPYGIAVSSDGSVYVADYNNSRIQKFDGDGTFVTKWGSGTNPRSISVAQDGSVYVVCGSGIQKFDNNGNLIKQIFRNNLSSISLVQDGSVYVVESGLVLQFDSNLNLLKEWYGQEEVVGRSFSFLNGITAAPDGKVYIAVGLDGLNHILLMITGGGSEKLFETSIPINQSANTSQDYTTNIGTLNATGKLYLNAELKNSLGQTIATSEYPFYIVEGTTLLLYSTDKKFYRPGETVTITGEVKNRSSITASALSLQISANSQNLYNAAFDIPANGTHPFTVITTAGSEGIYTLTGKVTQNSSTLVEIADQYEVALPKATVSVTAPEVVGKELFNINVEMKNEGKVDSSCQLLFVSGQGQTVDSQQITIHAGEKKVLQYAQQITSNANYTFTFTGDINQTITKTVAYGLATQVQFNIQDSNVYPEGKIAIPVTITNTGQLDETVTVVFSLQPSAIIQNKSYFIPRAGSVTDTLYYDLTEGSYQLIAHSSLPTVDASASFSVRKENKVDMSVTTGTQTSELLPVTVNLTNLGYNDINGSVSVSVSGQNSTVWNSSQDVSLPYSLNATPYALFFNINSSAITPGDYTLKAELLNNSNQQITVSSQPLTIKGPVFQLTQLPSSQTFAVGQEASFTFKVKNTGNQEGMANLVFKAYDLINSSRTEWLKPGEEKEIAFGFMLPDDLEEKDYFADYELQGSSIKGQVKYHVAGINLNVNAALDKQYYNEGETAHLTIAVSSQQSAVSLFARVNYNGYENQQAFVLNSASTLTFDIPLTQITGEKLFYGIYHEGGRSIHLNSLYIYKTGDAITITTNKQVYNTGETVSVSASASVSGITGTMTLSAPNYEETFSFSGTANKSFILPATMTAGTYNVSYQLSDASGQSYSGSHSFDVNGIQIKVLECKNDKGKYASTDTIKTSFTISSNINMLAVLKAWIVAPDGKYTSIGENGINLISSEPLLTTNNYSLTTAESGIHRLVYGIYSGDMLLVSGSEAFDVGDAVLLGLSTDKTDYPENAVPVQVKVNMFGTVDAGFELQLDGTTAKSETVVLNGFVTLNPELVTVRPGSHTLKGILTAGGLKSTKETSFVYGSNLPDLTAAISYQQSAISKDGTMQIKVTTTNQGRTPSTETTVALYDNDNLIETKAVNALNSGESQEITFIWNVLGKAGEHIIKTIADPDNMVTEFNEDNNTSQINITIPELTLVIETDKDTYKIRQKVNVISFITNLTSAKTYQNLILMTSAKDPSGNEVFRKDTVIAGLLPSGSVQLSETWSTAGLQADGAYTITQTVTSDSQIVANSSKLIALQKAPDFTIAVSSDYQKIKQGERATYIAHLEPVTGWSSAINLNMEGLPSGASVSFNPGSIIPPGEAITVVITTDATAAGIHNLSLTAQGEDEGEIIAHTLPLTLDVSGFGISAEPSVKTIKQLETAAFDMSLNAMNGYEGEVSLSTTGVPFGIRVSFDKERSAVPGNVKLSIITSKYVKPGTYAITVTGDDGLVKHKLILNLNINFNSEISAGIIVTPGPGPKNPASVKLISSELKTMLEFTAFNTKYGANAVMADIDGDGYDEIIVAPGPDPNAKAAIRVYRKNGSFMFEQKIFHGKYGLSLAAGDIDGDWKDEIVVGMGPDPKHSSWIKVLRFSGTGFVDTGISFDAFKKSRRDHDEHSYGTNIAIGDVDGDNIPELIAGQGPGPEAKSVIRIFKIDTSSGIGVWKISGTYSQFTAFAEHDTEEHHEGNREEDSSEYGVNIATGDIDGDGISEIIVGAGPDPKNISRVKVFRGDGISTGVSFIAYPEIKEHSKYSEKKKDSDDDKDDKDDGRNGYGVYVAATDINGDGFDEIITGAGPSPNNNSWVRIFNGRGTLLSNGFLAYPENIRYGVKVFTGKVGD